MLTRKAQEKVRSDDIFTKFWPPVAIAPSGLILCAIQRACEYRVRPLNHPNLPRQDPVMQSLLHNNAVWTLVSPQGPRVLGVVKADPGVGRSVESGLAAFRLRLTFLSMSIVHLLCVVCTLTPSSSDSIESSVKSASSLSPNAVGCCSCICNTIA